MYSWWGTIVSRAMISSSNQMYWKKTWIDVLELRIDHWSLIERSVQISSNPDSTYCPSVWPILTTTWMHGWYNLLISLYRKGSIYLLQRTKYSVYRHFHPFPVYFQECLTETVEICSHDCLQRYWGIHSVNIFSISNLCIPTNRQEMERVYSSVKSCGHMRCEVVSYNNNDVSLYSTPST